MDSDDMDAVVAKHGGMGVYKRTIPDLTPEERDSWDTFEADAQAAATPQGGIKGSWGSGLGGILSTLVGTLGEPALVALRETFYSGHQKVIQDGRDCPVWYMAMYRLHFGVWKFTLIAPPRDEVSKEFGI